jgi:hypothetical protein
MAAPAADVPGTLIAADRTRRRISGRLVPFDEIGTPAMGPERIRFAADGDHSTAADMWLNLEHDPARPIGRIGAVDVTDAGIHGEFTILETAAGSDALVEAAAGARAGLSVEAEILDYTLDPDGVVTITRSLITETALVRRAAFAGAAVTDVAAAAAGATENERETMTDATTAAAPDAAPDVTPTPAPDPVTVQAAAPTYAPPIHVSGPALPTPGAFILATLRRNEDPAGYADMMRRVRAAAPHTFVADVAGLVPESIVGPVVSLRENVAPVFNALGPLTAPAGSAFRIPVISPALEAAATGTEKSDVTKQLKVIDADVAMALVKRAVNLSAEAILYSQPSVIDVAVDQLAEAVNVGVEENVVATLAAVTGTNAAVAVAADGSDAWAKLAAGVAAMVAAVGRRPSHFLAAADVWAALAGMTNQNGAPIIAGVSQNLGGSWGSLFGVPVVVSPAIDAGKAFLVSDYGVKSWQNGTINVRVDEPTILGYAMGAGKSVGLSVASPKFITPVSVAAAP